MWQRFRRIPQEPLRKAVKWNFFTFIFGFLTIIIMVIINIWMNNYCLKGELMKQIKSLVFLYFAVGITMSIALDYYFVKSRKKNQYNSWIYGFAALIFFFSVIIFTLSTLNSAGKLPDFNSNNHYIQYFTLLASAIYSLSVKTFMFVIEK